MLKIVKPTKNTPMHVQIEVTWRCNWRCVHCYQDDHSVEFLSLEQLKRLFQELRSAGTMHVIVTGGEPLVRKDIFEVLEAIRDQGMAITLYTNGHLIDDIMADRLSKLIAMAEISILAGNEELSRVRGSYNRAWRAIKALTERQIDVMVKTPLMKPAYHTLKDLETQVHRLGAEWNVDPEISRTYAGQTYPLQYNLDLHELQQFLTVYPQFNPQSGYTADPGVREGLCLAARQYCFIDARGNVYPCLNFKSACDVRESQGLDATPKLGNILKDSFIHIWKNSTFAQNIREATVSNFTTCSSCKANTGCSPCMALNYEEHGELFKPARTVCNMTYASTSLFDPHFIPASANEIWNNEKHG